MEENIFLIICHFDGYIKFKNYEKSIKSPVMIYANFESILLPESKKYI